MARKSMPFDKKPQFFRMQVTEISSSTYTEASFATPNLTEMAFVMEILKIFVEMEADVALAVNDGIQISIHETSRTAMPFFNDSGVIMKYAMRSEVATQGSTLHLKVVQFDYTDGSGNGLLMGRKDLFMAVEGVSQTTAMIINAAILYRLVKVTPSELVGLISS